MDTQERMTKISRKRQAAARDMTPAHAAEFLAGFQRKQLRDLTDEDVEKMHDVMNMLRDPLFNDKVFSRHRESLHGDALKRYKEQEFEALCNPLTTISVGDE